MTSGKELWSDSNVLPEGHIGLNGEYFFRADGYVFGSPHFAIYDRQGLDATLERWGIGFASGSADLPPDGQALLEAKGLAYWMFDTAKLVNIMLQEDGHPLVHQEHDALVHVGGLLHYLWAPRVADADGEIDVDWARWANQGPRHQVARYARAGAPRPRRRRARARGPGHRVAGADRPPRADPRRAGADRGGPRRGLGRTHPSARPRPGGRRRPASSSGERWRPKSARASRRAGRRPGRRHRRARRHPGPRRDDRARGAG